MRLEASIFRCRAIAWARAEWQFSLAAAAFVADVSLVKWDGLVAMMGDGVQLGVGGGDGVR